MAVAAIERAAAAESGILITAGNPDKQLLD
jgi:hypothetical protein